MRLGEERDFPTEIHERFALMDSAPDAIIIVRPDGRIVFANALVEKLFGYGRDEIAGGTIEALVPERFRGVHVNSRTQYAREPRVRAMGAGLELYGRRKDGSEFPVEISLSPVETAEGRFIVSAIRDITERKNFERMLREKNEALEAANQTKDRFLASMSHELRTPLNAIIGFTGTMLMKLPGPLTSDQEHQLRIVQSSARHLLSLINDILDLAKVESGKIELFFEPVPIASLVSEVVDGLRSLAHEKNLDLTASTSEFEDDFVVSDRRALHQILINLTNNAIKYTERGTVHIQLGLTERDGKPAIQFQVIDTGIGIKPEDQARLFQAFEQLDTSSTRRFEGAGLGLYLSHKLATLLGGQLEFASEYQRGSTFTLSLPISR